MVKDNPVILGIDYGSKIAGTTAIAVNSQNKINLCLSQKKKDADKFIWGIVEKHQPDIIAIDAPLSIPLGLYNSNAKNYFYRKCDQDLHAMSPMFLGGLTARAMKLRDQLLSHFSNLTVLETYPKAQWNRISPGCKSYKKQPVSSCISSLKDKGIPDNIIMDNPKNWHEFDALLAWIGGYRSFHQNNVLYGEAQEGLIYV